MIPDVSAALKTFFLSIWTLLGSIQIPSTNLTGQHVLVAPLGALAFITVLKKILDIGGVAVSHSSGGTIGSAANYYENKDQEE